jgi:iron transport multicopper oxidase
MALSLSNYLVCYAYIISLITFASARTVTYDFNITWIRANPDGMFERPTIGINGEWPIPRIEATIGDRIVVNVINQLGNQSTSLHFHGLFQNGTNAMDGPAGVTQCAIPAGASFTYNFTVSRWIVAVLSPQNSII